MNIASTVLMSSRVYEEDDTAVFEGPLFVYSEVAQDFISYLHVIQSDHLISYMDNNKNGKILYALKVRFATLTTIPNTNSSKYPCGFNIKTDTKRFSFYCNSQLHLNSWMSRLRRYCFLTNWQASYAIVKQLASGKNSYVNLMEHKVTKTLVVGKVVKKELFIKHPHRLRNVKNEIAILAMIHSDLVVKFIEAYQDEKTITIVMEYLQGGMLFDRMTRKRCYSEREAAIVLKQLFESLALLHKNKILHRDVKLENIFLVSQDDDMRIKLGDFDLASLSRYIVHTKQCGTPGYMAPEVFHKQYGGYSPKTDVFSSGIVLYAMISGTFPYKAKDMEDLYERNKEGRLSMQGGLLSRLSPDCVDLLKRTLELNPKNRLTVDQVLAHPYIRRYSAAVKIAPHKVLFEDEENFLMDDIEEFKSTPKIPDTNMTSMRDNVSRISGISGQKLASFYKPSQNISGKSTTPRNKSSLRKSATVKDDCVTPARRSKSTLPGRQVDEGEIEEEVMKETMNDGISPIQNLHTLAAPTKRFMPR